ncbi:RHS repeat-associated core domain-containing protein, partial [Xenorhabdus doucetiae]|uniref:RHS repeat-associated core domain-containing protein n=1 Tax=Xenorhabdus doucetiae TaxID=351671 RepID=UPI002B406046
EDEESGLYYNRFRYYSPETAQYISPDPLNLAGGFNPYSYVHNPSRFIDPYGLSGTSQVVNKPDFYVGPDGPSATMPSTAYRYMNSEGPYAAMTIENKSAPLSYFGYSKYKSGSEARDAYQIFYEKGNIKSWSDARLMGEFDTLQLYKNGVPQVKVPLANGGDGPGLELFTSAYPQYGKGGAVQLLPIEKDFPVKFGRITVLPE